MGFQTKHASWDGGAISEHPIFQALAPQKTVKTQCGKRVSMSAVDNHDISCCTCLDEINREARALEQIRYYTHILETRGLDAANAIAATWGGE